MAEYSRLAEGTITTNGSPLIVRLPFQPDWVELVDSTGYVNAIASNVVLTQQWFKGMAQGTSLIEGYSPAGGNPFRGDFVASGGISTFAAGELLLYGPNIPISASTKGTTTTFTTSSAHGLSAGDVVILVGLYNNPTSTGMAQMSNIPFTVVDVASTTTFEVDWNSNGSNYTNLSSPPNAYAKKVLYPYLYQPGVNVISGVSMDDTTPNTQIDTTAEHNFVVGQEVGFRIPLAWGAQQLNELPNQLIPGSPKYYYVTEVVDSTTFVINVPYASLNVYNNNQPITSVPGLNFPQVFAVGDVNTGGWPYTGGNLYPSPVIGGKPTINGPAIQGAFVNNTAQGFSVGIGQGGTILGSIAGTTGDVVFYRAYLHDIYTNS